MFENEFTERSALENEFTVFENEFTERSALENEFTERSALENEFTVFDFPVFTVYFGHKSV